jgi:predicted dehydrogenase
MSEITNPIQTGLVSFGMSGQVFHGPLLDTHPGFYIKSVLERTSSRSSDKYPHIQIVRSLDELLKDDELELIIVNATNDTHYPISKEALEAGKHVIVEKPFTNTAEEGQNLIKLGLVEFIGNFDRYRNFIQENTWKEKTGPGSGLLYNLGPHLIDQAITLFGEPDAIHGDIRIVRTGGIVDDYFEVTLYYPDFKAQLHSSYLVREPNPRFILHGTEGSFVKYGLDVQEADMKAGIIPGIDGWGEEPEEMWGILNTTIDGLDVNGHIQSIPGNYLGFYNNIFDTIRNGAALDVTPEQALMNIHAIELAIESSRRKIVLDFY